MEVQVTRMSTWSARMPLFFSRSPTAIITDRGRVETTRAVEEACYIIFLACSKPRQTKLKGRERETQRERERERERDREREKQNIIIYTAT